MVELKLTIAYDNNAKQGLKAGWGFSCMVEGERKVLFDTGDDGSKLLYNLKKLGFDVGEINFIVLSHEHFDHTGGLEAVLEKCDKAEVVVLGSFSNGMKEKIAEKAELREVKESRKICEGVYSTGELYGVVPEQSLVVEGREGNVVVTGCAHPGLENILEKAREFGKIYGVLGGFHEFSRLDALGGIELIAPCHCTQRIREIKKKFETAECMAGSVFEVGHKKSKINT